MPSACAFFFYMLYFFNFHLLLGDLSMKKYIIWIAILALPILLSSCQNTSKPEENISTFSPTSDTSATTFRTFGDSLPSKFYEAEEQELYNLYVSIYNYMIGTLTDSLDRYFSYIEFQEEFALLDNHNMHYLCYNISNQLTENLDHAYYIVSKREGLSDLDKSFLDMYPSLVELIDCLNSIYKYTDKKVYLTDNYAEGKEYHSALWNIMPAYIENGTLFMEELDIVAEEHNALALEQLKENGYTILYTINMMFQSINCIQNEIYNQSITDDNILELNIETIEPLYLEITTNVEDILAYSEDKEQLEKEGILVNSPSWIFFLTRIKDVEQSLGKILQRVKDQKPYDYYNESVMSLPGKDSITSFQAGVSEIITYYNSFIR